MDVKVTFRPITKAAKQETLRMAVANGQGAERQLPVDGESIEGKVIFKDKLLDLQQFAVGIPLEKNITIKNASKNPSVYYLESNAPGITVTPTRGRVGAGSTVEIKVNIKAPKAHNYMGDSITVQARGGKVLTLQLSGEALIPDIAVEEEEIDFGGVTIGSNMKHPISLFNNASIVGLIISLVILSRLVFVSSGVGE